ncbi:hypothetical protein SKAU_G00095970 [Synaphobranchus kaupii]|uniref:Gypsy retrotransposon integrase-like protein 1 n=1 Tax=Synaphobranchus kaupii TaxID=118154 RepID=A0A9Q1FY72_SYNKA|nr:hypothetical protein SKAU_G00095970 [Synaphobranchus kaupii]
MDLLHTGIIWKCNSTYNSPIWPVLKASGKWRLTVDYRQLNKQVCLSRWPMAYLDETLTKVQNAAYFTSLDISNGFWTIPVCEEDQHKLAFSFNNVQYTWTVTPFGYANSPAEFNIFLHKAIPDVNSRNIAIYVDDILMWSDSWTAHRELLSYVLTRLSRNAHQLIYPVSQTTKSFSDVLCPTFPKVYVDGSAHRKTGTLGAGVGLVWTNCDLPPQKFKLGPKSSQYAELAGTLIALTQAAEHNYEHLVICTDSDYTVRSFIDYLPTGQPWEFGNPASQFSQPTDNSSVTIGTSELRNTQREADIPLFPQPPAQVDVVTRSDAKAPDPHNPSNSNRITLITPEAHNDLVQAQEKDQALTHLIRILQDTTSVADSGDLINDACFQALWKQKERLSLRDGLLTFKGTNDQHCCWVVPRQWRITMMQHAHDEPCGGHRGEQSTISMLRHVAYWPKMWTDVKDYVNSCLTCCKFQPVLPRHRAPLQSTPTTQPWSHIQIDWIGPITRSSRGNQYALTVTDMFTKWVECLPAPRDTAESTAVLLMNHVFTRWGLPQSVNSDRGTHFTSTIMEQVWKTLGVKRQLHVAYRPQSSGQVERANQTVINMLKKYLSANQRDWDIKLPLILMAIRATPSRATQVSPFEMMTGRQMVLLLHLLYTPTTGSAPEAVQTTSYLEELGRHLQSIFEFARQNMKTEAIGVKSYYDRKAYDREYEVGDEAFYYHFSRNQKRSKKLLPSWQGPYAITDKLSPVIYRIKIPTPRKTAHKWVHINQLRPYTPSQLQTDTGDA